MDVKELLYVFLTFKENEFINSICEITQVAPVFITV